ncbi:MAG TPA: Hsp20/alpha crystallin family protein [Kiritimatiellia bacterium]|nr:Hsp20/alpha crystallin family protein [Kiritimatiellia bacterium]
MTDQTSKKHTLLTILAAGLLVAFFAQSLALFGMQKKLAQLTATAPALPATVPAAIPGQSPSVPAMASLIPTHAPATPPAALPADGGDPSPGAAAPAQADPAARRQPRTSAHAPNQPAGRDDDLLAWDLDRWDPFVEMRRMQDRMNQMFLDAFNRFRSSDDFGLLLRDYPFAPDLNVEDRGDRYVVTVDLPGAENSQISVKYEDPLLTISGTVRSETTERDPGRILRQERRSGQFLRAVSLPGPVQGDKIATQVEKGVVTISVPKASS